MSINCASCRELIEDDPVRRGRLFFCSYECLEDYLSHEDEEHDEYDHRRDHEEI